MRGAESLESRKSQVAVTGRKSSSTCDLRLRLTGLARPHCGFAEARTRCIHRYDRRATATMMHCRAVDRVGHRRSALRRRDAPRADFLAGLLVVGAQHRAALASRRRRDLRIAHDDDRLGHHQADALRSPGWPVFGMFLPGEQRVRADVVRRFAVRHLPHELAAIEIDRRERRRMAVSPSADPRTLRPRAAPPPARARPPRWSRSRAAARRFAPRPRPRVGTRSDRRVPSTSRNSRPRDPET